MEDKSFIIEQVREFSYELTEAVKKLAKQLDENYKPFLDADMQDMLHSTNTKLFIAKQSSDNAIVGMVTVIVYRIPYTKKAIMEDLVVDESFRKHGIGSRLIETAVAAAKQAGASYLDFTSRKVVANTVYQHLGFQRRDTNVYRLML